MVQSSKDVRKGDRVLEEGVGVSGDQPIEEKSSILFNDNIEIDVKL